MTARNLLIRGKTGAHRAPLQLQPSCLRLHVLNSYKKCNECGAICERVDCEKDTFPQEEVSMSGIGLSNRLLVIVCLVAGMTASLNAQTATTGALTGTVGDASGALIPGVEVTATNTDTALERTVTTNENGFYRVPLLPPGIYKVKFSLPGFKSIEVPGITIVATESAVLNRSLEV